MSERPPLLWDLVRMVIKMIVGGIVVIALVSCGVASLAGAGASASKGAAAELSSDVLYGEKDSNNAILQVDVKGPILTHKPKDSDGGFFSQIIGVTYGYEVKEQLLAAAKNDDIKAVMMFVTTPGGSIVGSQAIHDGVEAVKAAGKPVVAYVDTISASGGVWSTAGADKIFADHGSLIGSVGVNFGNWFYYDDPVGFEGTLFQSGVATRGGIKTTFIGAGLGKDIGNPFRPMSEREVALLQATAEEFYEKFLDHVVANRGMDRTALVNQHGAMIYGNDLAEGYGYIDDTKTHQETLAYIAEKIGATGDNWKLVAPPSEKKSPFEEFFGAKAQKVSAEEAAKIERARACADLKSGPLIMLPQDFVSLCQG
ncbi:MAG: S49 family peptidase [Pseudomonadota bacterium]